MTSLAAHGLPFKSGLSEAALSAALWKVEQAWITRKRLIKNLQEALAEGQEHYVEEFTEALLFESQSLLACILRANKRLKPHARAPLSRCIALAETLRLDTPINEPVRLHAQEKSGGGFRVLADFGLRHRAAQHAVATTLGERFRPRPFQYTFKGVPQAIVATREAMASGLVYAAELDIQNFFGSFQPEELANELPLPKGVVEHVVIGRHMEAKANPGQGTKSPYAYPSHKALLTQARLGIPQGSACSPIVAAYCMSRLKWPQASDTALLNYADNFLLLAPSMARLEEKIGALTDAVSKLPGGHFKLNLIQKTHLTKPLVFLGHALQIKGGAVRIEVSPANWSSLCAKLAQFETPFSSPTHAMAQANPQKALDLLARFWAYASAWQDTFQLCDDAAELGRFWIEPLGAYAEAAGFSLEEVIEAVDESMGYEPTDYALKG